ncbi:MAG: DUF4188 domain-containing protein [Lysobacter sp.]|nr:DUF4188 domain-containing protein [Lysobacter sp.]
MAKILHERMTVDEREEFVVLLIGMRINRWWKVHKWLPVAWSMRRMVRQLGSMPGDTGYLGGEYRSVGNPIVFVQYWRSYDRLEAYAANRELAHQPMWGWFFKTIALKGDVGIYHEAYRIAPGNYESVYLNMPPFGLGRIFDLVPAARGMKTSRGRMDKLREPSHAAAAEPAPEIA